MASPRDPRRAPPDPTPPNPAPPLVGEPVAITIKTSPPKVREQTHPTPPIPIVPTPSAPGEPVAITIKTSPPKVREQAQKIELLQKQRSSSSEKEPDSYVRNSSFLSRDIEQKRGKESPPKTASPKRVFSPPKGASPPRKEASPPKTVPIPTSAPPKDVTSPPPVSTFKLKRADSRADENSVLAKANKIEAACSPPPKEVTSPPVSASFKRNDSKENSGPPKVPKRENSLNKDLGVGKTEPKCENFGAVKIEPAKSVTVGIPPGVEQRSSSANTPGNGEADGEKAGTSEESQGVGDKIKKFEKAAEDASAPAGRLSRPGSVRGRSRTERLGSDPKEDFPPPATPFKDNVHFDLAPEKTEPTERLPHGIIKPSSMLKWQRSESHEEKKSPPKIVKPEFKPMPSSVDATIRSPSLGAKIADQFPSQGTAFRNVASPDQTRQKFTDDANFKPSKLKPKEKSYEKSISKGSSYFTRGSEEIWLVKKKDIEEIEERVLDSFRRAGGNLCLRDSMRPASEGGQGGFTHATMGRNKRQAYARSESCDPQWGATRAHTLKRQTSVACTCGHDKKPVRAKSVGEPAPRPRSRSHGDDAHHVLDKYETLV